jgi:hypothetical protein
MGVRPRYISPTGGPDGCRSLVAERALSRTGRVDSLSPPPPLLPLRRPFGRAKEKFSSQRARLQRQRLPIGGGWERTKKIQCRCGVWVACVGCKRWPRCGRLLALLARKVRAVSEKRWVPLPARPEQRAASHGQRLIAWMDGMRGCRFWTFLGGEKKKKEG